MGLGLQRLRVGIQWRVESSGEASKKSRQSSRNQSKVDKLEEHCEAKPWKGRAQGGRVSTQMLKGIGTCLSSEWMWLDLRVEDSHVKFCLPPLNTGEKFVSMNIFSFFAYLHSCHLWLLQKESWAYAFILNFMYFYKCFLKCLVHNFIFCCNHSCSLHKRFANKSSDFSSEPKHF
jgi:hypothetical protein